MAIATGQTPGYDDPLYSQGMAHLQGGRWQEAIRCFEALAQRYPDDRSVEQALDEARFKAKLDAVAQPRAKRWIFPWRKVLVRGAILVLIVFVILQGVQLFRKQIGPMLEQRRVDRQRMQVVDEIQLLITAEDFDPAEQKLTVLLAEAPDYPAASGLAEVIAAGRERKNLYDTGAANLAKGELTAAQIAFADLQARFSDYRTADVTANLQQIERRQALILLFKEGEASALAGRCAEAIAKLEQVRSGDLDYERPKVERYLADCYLAEGLAIVNQVPPEVSRLPEALNNFEQTLTLRPKDAEAGLQRDLSSRFLLGKERFDTNQVERALPLLRSVYDLDPAYLNGLALSTLYDAYVSSGDGFRAAGNCNDAYEQYRKACQELPVKDNTQACARFEEAVACVTPTSTPTPTPTMTPTPTPTRTPRPTAPPAPTPTAIPARVLIQRYKGKILFRSDNPEQTGWWVMDADGSDRIFLGDAAEMQVVYEELRERETLSPDGTCRTYTTQTGDDDYPAVYAQCQPPAGGVPDVLPTWRISQGLIKVAYDPVWSPDGRRIAFVSQNKGSDDVWIANAEDGSNQWDLTPNKWEWDKHPSWAPDSRNIVFWTNREGTKQIYIVDADDLRIVNNISKVPWDEYNPVWLK